ncbi:MAG TPA: bifunctional oligoribonuclease/PAP phosphatase NrnA [Thermomicrobiaceae bacterium]|nr:bifunctional oligoribonuclease/PAP phosphatase NrnA [Thermomicrobiaceae bacterium]
MIKPDAGLAGESLDRAAISSAWETICGARRTVALTHANPDADAVASLLALTDLCVRAGHEVVPAVGDGELPDTLRFLPGAARLVPPEDLSLDGVDLLVMLDCADEMRVGPTFKRHPEWFDGRIPIVNIDHHVTNTRFGSINLIDPDSAATAELLGLMFLELGIDFDADVATCLLAGVQGDTLGLRTPSTRARTLRLAAVLLERQADLDTVVDNLFRVKPFSTVRLWGLVLSRAQQLGPVVWAEITPEMLATSGAAAAEGEGIVNFLAGSKGSRVGALLYQQPDGWRVSLRSVREDVNVAELARRYGGGGHPRAAGCRLAPGDEARDNFLADLAARLNVLPLIGG